MNEMSTNSNNASIKLSIRKQSDEAGDRLHLFHTIIYKYFVINETYYIQRTKNYQL